MRKIIFAAVVCLGSAAAFGQMATSVKVTLPVAATVGGVTLPAGDYTIREMENGTVPVLQITSFKGKNVAVMVEPVISLKNADKTQVVLKQTEEGYKIQSLSIEGEDTGFDFE